MIYLPTDFYRGAITRRRQSMKRRQFIISSLGLAALPLIGSRTSGGTDMPTTSGTIEKIIKSNKEWKRILTPEQYDIVRDEGTEKAHSSALNHEQRRGTYICAACELPLSTSDMKYESGTGWPSFYTTLPGAVETKRDWKLIIPRTEYHCARCGGHQGHVFDDGPQPTGQRWCNNGLALKFTPAGDPLPPLRA